MTRLDEVEICIADPGIYVRYDSARRKKAKTMDETGIEPMTSPMRRERATNCATRPDVVDAVVVAQYETRTACCVGGSALILKAVAPGPAIVRCMGS